MKRSEKKVIKLKVDKKLVFFLIIVIFVILFLLTTGNTAKLRECCKEFINAGGCSIGFEDLPSTFKCNGELLQDFVQRVGYKSVEQGCGCI
jgi:hypothetical protein